MPVKVCFLVLLAIYYGSTQFSEWQWKWQCNEKIAEIFHFSLNQEKNLLILPIYMYKPDSKTTTCSVYIIQSSDISDEILLDCLFKKGPPDHRGSRRDDILYWAALYSPGCINISQIINVLLLLFSICWMLSFFVVFSATKKRKLSAFNPTYDNVQLSLRYIMRTIIGFLL